MKAATPVKMMRGHVRLLDGMVGSFGDSINPEVSKKFLAALQEVAQPTDTETATEGKFTLVCRGTVPEFSSLSTEYLATDNASLMLKLATNIVWDRGYFVSLNVGEIFSRLLYGDYAAVISDGNCLTMLQSGENLLHLVCLRKTLGEAFFFPTIHDFPAAVEKCPEIKRYLAPEQTTIIFPNDQVWECRKDGNFKKFRVRKT